MSDPATIVVGYRSGAAGIAALRYSAWLAAALDATLCIVHVTELDDYPVDPDGLDWEDEANRRLAAVRTEVATTVQGHAGTWTYEVAHGEPSAALVRIAIERHASMVVVGTAVDGRAEAVHRLFVRSVGRALLGHVRCPVLVVPCVAP